MRFARHVCLGCITLALVMPAWGEGPPTGLSPELTTQLGQLLERDWDGRPPWADMAVMILKGDGMGSGKGWFTGSLRRHDWNWLQTTFTDAAADQRIERDEKDRADFYAVYIKEAHPIDGWRSGGNTRAGIEITQATSFEQRVEAAAHCCGALQMTIPLVVDGIDNRVGEAYSGFPDRLYVIDRTGKVAYKGGRGPFGFMPGEMEQSLLLLLLDEAMQTETGGGQR